MGPSLRVFEEEALVMRSGGATGGGTAGTGGAGREGPG